MPSKNVSSADNQQERLKTIGWLLGFIDGEGCFSVSFIRNSTTKLGWQIFPEFVVTQGKKSLYALKKIEEFFGCGKIFINRRHDNHNEDIYRYCVRSIKDLKEKIIPFFQKYHLQTAKKNDFELFAKVVIMMNNKVHFNIEGTKKIVKIAEKMNRKKSIKFLKSSETIRQTLANSAR